MAYLDYLHVDPTSLLVQRLALALAHLCLSYFLLSVQCVGGKGGRIFFEHSRLLVSTFRINLITNITVLFCLITILNVKTVWFRSLDCYKYETSYMVINTSKVAPFTKKYGMTMNIKSKVCTSNVYWFSFLFNAYLYFILFSSKRCSLCKSKDPIIA